MKKRLFILALALLALYAWAPTQALPDPNQPQGVETPQQMLEAVADLIVQNADVHVQVVRGENHTDAHIRFTPGADNRTQRAVSTRINQLAGEAGTGFLFDRMRDNYIQSLLRVHAPISAEEAEAIFAQRGLQYTERAAGQSLDTGSWTPPLGLPAYKMDITTDQIPALPGFTLQGIHSEIESVIAAQVETTLPEIAVPTQEPNKPTYTGGYNFPLTSGTSLIPIVGILVLLILGAGLFGFLRLRAG